MRFERLVLKNFRSYLEAEIGFGNGLYLILGENGSGKTSILEAIRIALFKGDNESVENFVHQGMDGMKVMLEFISDGKRYRVERERRRNSSAARLYRPDDEHAPPIHGDREVGHEIRRILGIDREQFLNAIYVRQGEIDQLISETPARRKEIIARLLGIDSLKKAERQMMEVMRPFEVRREHLRSEVARRGQVEEELQRARERHLCAIQEETRLKTHEAQLNAAFENFAARQEELERRRERYMVALATLNETGRRIEERKGRDLVLRQEAADITEAESRMRELQAMIERMGPMEHLSEAVKERERLRSEMDRTTREMEVLESEFRSIGESIRRELDKGTAMFGRRIGDLDELNEAIQLEIGRIGEELERTGKAREALVQSISQLRREIQLAEEKMEVLRSSGATCPVCETPLPPHRRVALLSSEQEHVARCMEEIQKARGEEERLAGRIREMERSKEQLLRHANTEALRRLLEQQARLYEECERKMLERERLSDALKAVESTISELAPSLGLAGIIDSSMLRREHEHLVRAMNEYHRLTGRITRKQVVLEELHTLHEELQALEGKLEALRKEISALNYNDEEHRQIKEMTEQKRWELQQLRIEIAGKHKEAEFAEREISTCQKELERLASAQNELRRTDMLLERLVRCREIFGRDGAQRELRMIARPIIERNMRSFFSEFDFEYSDVQLDEDYGISVYGPAGRMSVEMMSGGERIAIAIAMRLALAKALAGGAVEAIMLDEPTIHLDAQRRRDLVKVFRKLGSIPQMLIVTHDSDLEEVADKIVMVRKEHGISAVSTLSAGEGTGLP